MFTCENCCREIDTEECPYCDYDNGEIVDDISLTEGDINLVEREIE